MSDVDALYGRLILEHSRSPRRFGPLPGAIHHGHRSNPFCGDDITVALALTPNAIADVHFHGAGCAIAIAAASMMTDAVAGRARAEAEALAQRFIAALTAPASGAQIPLAGDLAALTAVVRFPVRVECACLPWRALLAALAGA